VTTLLLILANLSSNTGAHISLKLSASSNGRKRFIFWQLLGNLAGFLGVLAFTALLRSLPLHVAYPLTEGLTSIGVLLVGGVLVLKEKIRPIAWAGAALILAGIALFSL
jgi:multidrug transporter EmrE-like cation transporter